MRQRPGALLLLALAACQPDLGVSDPILDASSAVVEEAGVIPGRFIITVEGGVDPVQVAAAHGVSPDYVYRAALNGFAGNMPEFARQRLMADRRVQRIEPDRVVEKSTPGTQTNPVWGLDRIDQRALPLNSSYVYDNQAASVSAYIIDTGIRYAHVEFGGRASFGFDTFGGTGNDCDGHGTHVAGTVGGTTYGVAKSVRLVAVRVLNCSGSGTTSGVIAGVNWVTANHVKPAVANMSLGGGTSSSLDDAVRNMVAAGVATSLSAGNSNTNACNGSPARVAEAMTVGATGTNDARASFSNYGSCVQIFAPGVGILSAYANSNTSTATLSGTSMSAPHVAGVASLYLQANPTSTASQVHQAVYDLSTKGVVTNALTARNDLVHSRVGGSAPPPQDDPPQVSWVEPTSGQTVAGTIAISIAATDDNDPAGSLTVQWRINATAWHATTYSASAGLYEAAFPTTLVADGSYTLEARATDSRGQAATSSITVTIANAEPPPPPPPPAGPTVSWVSPTSGATISGVAPMAISATSEVDTPSQLTVEWRIIGSGGWHRTTYNAGSGNWEGSWPTTRFANGAYSVEARVTESGGATATSTIGVQISN